MEGACLRLGFGLESSTGRLSPPTPEIRFRSLKGRLAPPCPPNNCLFNDFATRAALSFHVELNFSTFYLTGAIIMWSYNIWYLAPMPALSPGPSAHATSWLQFLTVHSPSSVPFVSIRRTALRVPSLLSVLQASCASFVFMHLRIANFTTPFFSQPYKMPGVCTHAHSLACFFPRACVTFLLFDTLLLRRYYQFFSYGTPSALAVPAADSHETRLF